MRLSTHTPPPQGRSLGPIVGLVSLLFFLLFGASAMAQGCANIDFEQGNFNGWIGGTGTCCPINITANGIMVGRHTIMTGTNTDPNTCGIVSEVAPGGLYSCRLGNDNVGAEAENISYTFTVGATNNLFIYKYAVVMEDPGHTASSQPRFEISVTDQAGNLVDPQCGYYQVTAAGNVPGFQTCGNVQFKDWTTVGMDMTPYTGQTVTVEFRVGDCNLGGHFGYAYLEAECAPLEISTVYCQNSNNVVVTAPAGFTYLWSNGATTQSATVTNPIPGDSMTVTLISVTGCLVQLTSILDPTLITPEFTYTTGCSNTAQFSDITSIVNGTLDYVEWDFGDGSPITTGGNQNHFFPNPGTYTVTMTAYTLGGCSQSISHQVTMLEEPVANFNAITACANELSFFNDLSTLGTGNITSWLWDFGDGNNSTQQNPSHTYGSAGAYNVQLTVTSDSGCTHSITQPVQAHPAPLPQFTVQNACEYDLAAFNDISTIPSGSITGISWDLGDGNGASGPGPTHLYPAAGTYQVTLIATSDMGCVDSITHPMHIHPVPQAAFTAEDVCFNNYNSFIDISTIGSGWYTTMWNFGDNSTSQSSNPVHYYNSSGTYQVQLTITSDSGCVDIITQPVEVFPTPNAGFLADKRFGCAPLCVQFTDTTLIQNGSVDEWVWYYGDGGSGSGAPAEHCYNDPGNYDVTLIVTTQEGCRDSITYYNYITVYPSPVAGFVATPWEASINSPQIEFNDHSAGASQWNWDFGDGDGSGGQNPTHTYADTGWYTVTLVVHNQWGCQDATSDEVYIRPEWTVWIPNAFTPDGDGLNDTFFPKWRNVLDEGYRMLIFNRWGEKLYETEDRYASWDGYYKGQMVKPDVYVYRIMLQDVFHEHHNYLGHVTLVR